MTPEIPKRTNSSFDLLEALKYTPLVSSIPLSNGTENAVPPKSLASNTPLCLSAEEKGFMQRYLDLLEPNAQNVSDVQQLQFYKDALSPMLQNVPMPGIRIPSNKEENNDNPSSFPNPLLNPLTESLLQPSEVEFVPPEANLSASSSYTDSTSMSENSLVSKKEVPKNLEIPRSPSTARILRAVEFRSPSRSLSLTSTPNKRSRSESGSLASTPSSKVQRLQDVIEKQVHDTQSLLDVTLHANPEQSNCYVSFGASEAKIISAEVIDKISISLTKLSHLGDCNKLLKEEDAICLKMTLESSLRSLDFFKNSTEDTDIDEDDDIAYLRADCLLKTVSLVFQLINTLPMLKKLQNEESFLFILDTLHAFIDYFFLKAMTSIDMSMTDVSEPSNNRQFLSLTQKIANAFTLLSKVVHIIPLSEAVVIKVVFLSTKTITVDSSVKEKPSLIQNIPLDILKIPLFDTLQFIFSLYPAQRDFVLQEVLANFAQLPTARSTSRTFKLSSGKSVQLYSTLLVRLLQSCTVTHLPEDTAFKTEDPAKDLVNSDDFQSYLKSVDVLLSKSRHEEYRVANQIVSYLLGRSLKQTKSEINNSFVTLTRIMLEDLLNMLTLPEWAGTETLVRQFALNLIMMIVKEKNSVATKNTALDFFSVIVNKLLITFDITLFEKHDLPVPSNFNDPSCFLSGIPRYEEITYTCLSHLSSLCNNDDSLENIIPYTLNQWVSFLFQLRKASKDSESNYLVDKILLKSVNLNIDSIRDSSVFTSDEMIKDYFILSLYRSSLYLNLKFFVSLIIGFLDSPQTSLRTKSLRIISQMKSIPAILHAHPEVLSQVINKVTDPSAFVRDTVLDLLSTYMMAFKETINQLYIFIAAGVSDSSVSVRKRAIKQLAEIYGLTNSISIRCDICMKLLSRMNDEEENLTDLSLQTLDSLWFNNSNLFIDTQKKYDDLSFLEKQKLKVHYRPLLKLSSDPSPELHVSLVTTLKKMLTSKEDVLTKEFCSRIRFLLSFLFTLLIEVATEDEGDDVEVELLHETMSTLFVFSRSFPFLFDYSQLQVLKPYLKSASSIEEQRLLYYVVAIFRQVLPRQKEIPEVFLRNLETTMLQRLTKAGSATLKEMVPCLCYLLSHLNDHQRLYKILGSCLKTLEETRKNDFSSLKAFRLIELIGLFARFGGIEKIDVNWEDVFPFPKDESNNIYVLLLNYMNQLLPSSKTDLRIHVIENMLKIVLAQPTLFTSPMMLSMLDKIFEESNTDCVSVIFRAFLELLAADEDLISEADEKLESKSNNNKKSKREQVNVDMLKGFTERQWTEGVSACLMQKYLSNILNSCFSKNLSFALLALNILQHIIRQGLANPRLCFPVIVALEASEVTEIKQTAINLHVELHQKHESLVDGLYAQAANLMFSSKSFPGSFVFSIEEHSAFQDMYNVVLSNKNTRSRRKFLTQMLKLIEFDNEKLLNMSHENVLFFNFCCSALGGINYLSIDEPLMILQVIDTVLATIGLTITEWMKGNLEEPYKFFSGILLCNFIHLKRYLKYVYSITDEKIHNFDSSKTFKDKKVPLKNNGYKVELLRPDNKREDVAAMCIKMFEDENISTDPIFKDDPQEEEHSGEAANE
ncbi:adherin [Schizosaccharomyces cryophilus OY26]|uniref:Sister chromatid cohesion protein n=1 Tax=Schizosaccharomyces cryophilus (strain OY26 / ATCC MYA-4695 / CBS 11777 / NBRC 106824 / NRRL Y48691) TaxID=653667 RepID=S9W4M8_SCHCR|nr:adherin [Schizosaccharomyces cryophilus OY26]EPY53474.1 adherin [Schizosaccharomyces cryophilus OY26]